MARQSGNYIVEKRSFTCSTSQWSKLEYFIYLFIYSFSFSFRQRVFVLDRSCRGWGQKGQKLIQRMNRGWSSNESTSNDAFHPISGEYTPSRFFCGDFSRRPRIKRWAPKLPVSAYDFMVGRNRGLSSVKLDLGLVERVIAASISIRDTSYKLTLIARHRGGHFHFSFYRIEIEEFPKVVRNDTSRNV